MKNTLGRFAGGFALAAIMCALAFGVTALRGGHPALMIYLDHDHLPGFALSVLCVCLGFAAIWTVLTSLRPRSEP